MHILMTRQSSHAGPAHRVCGWAEFDKSMHLDWSDPGIPKQGSFLTEDEN